MMFEKGKRERRNSEEDRVFNRMLLWLAGAVAVELLMLLLQQAYVVMRWGGPVAKALLTFFEVFSIAGAVIAAGCAAWALPAAACPPPSAARRRPCGSSPWCAGSSTPTVCASS